MIETLVNAVEDAAKKNIENLSKNFNFKLPGFFHKEQEVGDAALDARAEAAAHSVSKFFDISEAKIQKGDAIGVYKKDVGAISDNVFEYNLEQFKKMNCISFEDMTKIWTHECGSRLLQGMFPSPWACELGSDFFVGVRSEMLGLPKSSFEELLGSTVASELYPDGALRMQAIDYGRSAVAKMKESEIRPTWENCVEYYGQSEFAKMTYENLYDDMTVMDPIYDCGGDINVIPFDTNGNGLNDVFLVFHYTGDGICDTFVKMFDYNEDGRFDSINVRQDLNGDGQFEYLAKIYDSNRDGEIDIIDVYFDSNGSGHADIHESYAFDSSSGELIPTVATDFEVGGTFSEDLMNFDPNDVTDADAIIGDPTKSMEFWEFQGDTQRCALYSQMFVIEELTGQNIDIEDFVGVAKEQGWFTENGGTTFLNMNKMLDYYGVENDMSFHNSISDIEDCLNKGGKVIVSIDSAEIWYGEENNIFSPVSAADHAVEVIGVDRSDPENPMVILNDSGTPNGKGEMVPLDVFEGAWEDGDCQMVSCYKA